MLASSARLARLNPANSLFGKIFIWFWLSVSLLVVSAFIIARLIRPTLDIAQASEEQLNRAQRVANIMQLALNRGVEPERALRRVSNRGRWQLVLVDMQSQELLLGFPAPILPFSDPLLSLAHSQQALLITSPSLEFIGPIPVSLSEQEKAQGLDYKLFVGRLLKREERQPVSWGLSIIILLMIGSALCLLLAYRLSKPLSQLSLASQRFASGDLSTRVSASKNRQDEIGKLTHNFNRMAERINANMQAQQSLLANVSHELRTPLTRLQLASAMLEDKLGDDKYLSRIELEISHMDALIAEILALSRLQSENQGLVMHSQVNIKPIELSAFVSDTVSALQIELKAKSKILSVQDTPSLTLCCDQKSLASALDNVLRNALRHAKRSIWLSFETQDKSVSIIVEDDGDGVVDAEGNKVMQKEALEKLLEPFYQSQSQASSETGTNKIKGSGLGLAIAKAAMILNKGTISVSASSHGGLRFNLQIPIMRSKQSKDDE